MATTEDETRSSLYARKSTGLVREISVGSAFAMNVAFLSFPYGFLLVTLGPFSFPGANIALVALLAAVIVLFPITLYGSLGQAMPRSGGDYVFVSRIISPSVGFASSFNIQLWFVIATAGLAASLAPYGLGSAFGAIGVATGNSGMTNLAADVSSRTWQFWLGAGVLAATMLMAHFDVSYNGILSTASKAGYAGGQAFSLKNTILATPLAASSFVFGIASTYYGGEIRHASRTILKGLLYALGTFTFFYGLCLLFAERTLGQSFLGSATYLANVDPKQYPFAASPSLYFFTALTTKNDALIIIMQIGFAVALYLGFIVTCLIMVRSLFAWSFDRILPDAVSSVSGLTRTPLVANVVVFICMIIFLALIVYGPNTFQQILLTAVAGQLLTMIYVAISGIILPWRRPDLYEQTPLAGKKLLGLPAISIVGTLSLGAYLLAVAVILVAGYPLYFLSRWVNRRRGVDLGLAFRQLPPE